MEQNVIFLGPRLFRSNWHFRGRHTYVITSCTRVATTHCNAFRLL